MNRRKFLNRSTLVLGGALGASTLLGKACVVPATQQAMAEIPVARFYGRQAREKQLIDRLTQAGFPIGARMHLMAFKETSEMEIWLQKRNGKFFLFDVLPICAFSGSLGPKLAEGDRQTPEGYYYIWPQNLYPDSAYHLALGIGFPNTVERRRGWTGSLIRIHGSCQSIGCYSMGDRGVETIYLLAEQSFKLGKRFVTFAAYPFRPTARRLAQEEGHVWYDFWNNLAGSYRQFMRTRRRPEVFHVGTRYLFQTL